MKKRKFISMTTYFKIKYWLYIIWLSLKAINKTSLGDIVYYKGKEYIIINGAVSDCWTLVKGVGNEIDNEGQCVCEVTAALRKECRKKLTPMNYLKNIGQRYRFFMSNWYDIWVNDGEIAPWIRSLRIW